MQESSLILKQDAMGRVRSTPGRRSAVVAVVAVAVVAVVEFRRSGLSG